MANTKDTTVKYVNKDFSSFKRDLMRYAQAHFSGSYQDFNETSPGMMVLELQAYVADVLAFYMDQQFLEIKQSTARQIENIEDFAKMRGYKPRGPRSARVKLDFVIEVPLITIDGAPAPDPDYLPILRAGSQAQGPGGVIFETLEDLDFSVSSNGNPQLVVEVPNSNPQTVAVRRWAWAIAAQTVTEQIDIQDFEPFKRIDLAQSNVQEIRDVFDREGHQWYEVEYLAQNVVFDQIVNSGDDNDVVPYILKWRSTPRRFVLDGSVATGKVSLQFGNGQGLKFDDELVPNIANLALPIEGRPQFSNFTLDPQNFLKTRTLGLSPYNTRLTVRYRVGGGSNTNVPALTINKMSLADLVFKKTIGGIGGLDPQIANMVKQVEVFNVSASDGGGEAETAEEIKVNAASYFAAQARAVTSEDFITHVLSMPERFGRPEKVFVRHSDTSPSGIDIHILSVDPNGNFSHPTSALRENVKTYLRKLRMLTQGITILDSNIINLAINFGVVISPKFNRAEVLTNCIAALKAYFVNDNMQVGMPIVFSDVEASLQAVPGVISVYKLDIELRRGGSYANDINFDVKSSSKHGILYCPQNAIFEVKFPDIDIVGESK